ncbi:MAG: hypothetical protein HY079_04050 [Elusimicrobia bacterium]|nr:hypothetical protein [Elusimicrobiota bacterium]
MRVLRAAAVLAAALLAVEGGWRACRWTAARLRRDTPPRSFELYAVGESTMAGAPYPKRAGPAFLVKKILGGTVDRRTIAVTVVARAGESVFPQAAAFEDAVRARRRDDPGAVLIYAGHNDAAYEDATPAFERFRERWLYRSLVVRDLSFLLEERVPALRARSLGTYEHHLRRIVETALASGLTPVLTVPASNLADADPWLDADGGAYRRWEAGRALARRGRWAEAAPLFRAAADARVPDNFGRATSAQAAVIRRLAAEYGVPLVDADALFAAASPHGVPGDELFVDGQHPDFRGYALLAGAYARALAERGGAKVYEPMAWSPRLMDDLGLTKEEQALALVEAGRWWFSVASRHARPGLRLDAAEARFRAALAADPACRSARVGLVLTAAARRPDFLDRNVDWLGARKLFYGGRYDLSAADRSDLADRARAAGVPEALLKAL